MAFMGVGLALIGMAMAGVDGFAIMVVGVFGFLFAMAAVAK